MISLQRAWGDDHVRSLLRCRHAIIFRWWNDQGGRAFHNNFWPEALAGERQGSEELPRQRPLLPGVVPDEA